MIRFAKDKDKEDLLELCVKSQPLKEKQFLNYYFENEFQSGCALISELDNLLVSQIHRKDHVLLLMNKQIEVSYLFAIATHYDYRRRGIMKDLIEMQIEDCSKNHLVTFLESNNPKLFERYGFDIISFRKRYVIYARELMKFSNTGVNEIYTCEDLVCLYKDFAKVFDCYYERDEEYYNQFIDKANLDEGKICVYREDNEIKGYALFFELDDGIEVKEIIYKDGKSLCHMLRYAIGYNPFVSVEVSQAEHLEKIFKMSIPRTFGAVMARINDLKLYNKLFNTNCKSAKDIEKTLSKPILINEKY